MTNKRALYFVKKNWLQKELSGKLIDPNLSNFSIDKHDLVLCKKIWLSRKVIDSDYQKKLVIDLFKNNKQFSDHKSMETKIESSKIETLSVTKPTMYAFKGCN